MHGSLRMGALVGALSILAFASLGFAADAQPEVLPRLLRVESERTTHTPLARASDDTYWATGFGNYNLEGSVHALLEWNGRLVAGGDFVFAGNEFLMFVGAWNGEAWEPLPDFGVGLVDSLYTSEDAIIELLPFEDDIVAVGRFLRGFAEGRVGRPYRMRVARWDGSTWTRLGTDLRGRVTAAVVHGGELYVGGEFDDEELANPTSILRWTGTAWEPLDGAPSEGVTVLFDDGDALLAAGAIPTADDPTLFDVLAFDGIGWSTVGAPSCRRVRAIARFDGDLYVGSSQFPSCGATPSGLTRLEGSEWVSVGGGLSGPVWSGPSTAPPVLDLRVLDGRLVVAGDFLTAGDTAARALAAWDGSAWSGYGEGLSGPGRVLAPWGDALAVGGGFQLADGVQVDGLGIWSGGEFRPVRRNQGIEGSVWGFLPTEDGLFMSGWLESAGGELVRGLTRWNGERFESVGDNLFARYGVDDLVVHEGQLHAVGLLEVREDSTWTRASAARFDGTKWHQLDVGLEFSLDTFVTSWRGDLVLFGRQRVEGASARPVLGVYDGTSFTEIPFVSESRVSLRFLTVYRDRLIVGGVIREIEGAPFNNIAAWDGVRWDTLKGGVGGTAHDAIIVDDELVVAGHFLAVGPYVPARGIARWNGERWSTFGEGFTADEPRPGSTVASVQGLTVHHGRLHAAGSFDRSGQTPLRGVARWNGDSWEPLGSGVSSSPQALASWNDALFVGGGFREAGGRNSGSIARWDAPPDAAWANRPQAGVRVDPAVPNPFNPRTTIVFSMAQRDRVRVEVVDARGRRVAVVLDGIRDAGEHRVEWLGTDATGRAVASGVYYVRVRGASGEDAGAVTLLR